MSFSTSLNLLSSLITELTRCRMNGSITPLCLVSWQHWSEMCSAEAFALATSGPGTQSRGPATLLAQTCPWVGWGVVSDF